MNRARRRWLVSAMVNAGGRWAVLPAGVVALAGIALALAGVRSLVVLLPLVVLGFVGAGAAVLITRRVYSRPAAAGAPDWSLLLDRALGLNDALPAYIEGQGKFSAPLEARISAALDPAKEKQAAPRRHYVPLAVALILALFPLVSWLPDPSATPEAPEVAQHPAMPSAVETPEANSSGGGAGDTAEGEKEGEGDRTESSGGAGDEGKAQKRPDGQKTEGGAGTPPEDAKPEPLSGNPAPKEGGIGDKNTPPTDMPKPEDKDVETDLTKIKPTAGDGETRTEDRSRWVYNPDGESKTESVPAGNTRRGDERAMPRTKLTTSERKLIEGLYRKLYE